jgi:hypothetical protein
MLLKPGFSIFTRYLDTRSSSRRQKEVLVLHSHFSYRPFPKRRAESTAFASFHSQ